MNDAQIIQALRENKHDNALAGLYNYFPVIKKMIVKNGGSADNAFDIYQEALIIICRKVKEDDFKLTSKLDSFIYGICNYLWKDELKKQHKQHFVELIPGFDHQLETEINALVEQEESIKIAEQAVAGLGEKCRKILELFYFKNLAMKEIAYQMGFASEQVAKNKKYKCLEEAKAKLLLLKKKSI